MAQRRMFSLKIIDTDVFLDMPASSQLLYFHLAMRADDDGFVASPRKIMRIIGASDDDYKILVAKKFVLPFASGVCVIIHWRIHNYIQTDRHTPTIYKEEMANLTTDNSNVYSVDTKCIQNDSIVYPQVRLGKDRIEIGKDRVVVDQIGREEVQEERGEGNPNVTELADRVPYQEIIALYHKHCRPFLPQIKFVNDERKRKMRARWKNELSSLALWEKLFSVAAMSNFLMGKVNGSSGMPFRCNFDWLICPRNVTKILEGNYVND